MNKNAPTMYAKLITLLFIGSSSISVAQLNNAIFNGGLGSGFEITYLYTPTNNSIFWGNQDDGFTMDGRATEISNTIYRGGMDDGFLAIHLQEIVHSNMFHGGPDDGWTTENFSTIQHNVIWSGRLDDGWSSTQLNIQTNSLVFAGGSDDGFSNSGISKMRWNGKLSDEWLVAGNWTPNIVPGKNDAAWIPKVNSYYPILKVGMLGLNVQQTYSCKELHVEPFASVTLNQTVGLISNGYLGIKGTLNFLGVGTSTFIIHKGSILDVDLGGVLNIVNP